MESYNSVAAFFFVIAYPKTIPFYIFQYFWFIAGNFADSGRTITKPHPQYIRWDW